MSLSSFIWSVADLLRGDYNREPLLPRKANPPQQTSTSVSGSMREKRPVQAETIGDQSSDFLLGRP